MISLNTEQICLLELLKASLFNISPLIPNKVNWEMLFEIAKTQCIIPLIANQVPVEHRNDYSETTYQSKAHFMQIMYEQNYLVNILKNNHIKFVVLKGAAAAIYYPVPSLRTFGDIDFFISNDSNDTAIEILKNNGYRFVDKNERHYEFERNGIEFELHSKFSCRSYNDIDHIILSGLNSSIDYKISNYTFPGLPAYANGLVLLGHIMQHLKTSGIGLRQIIDWMMFVHNELDDSAWSDHFCHLSREAGLEKLAITITSMCIKWLGLPNEITWCNSADKDVADQLLLRIMDEGNLGRDRAQSDFVKVSLKREGTFKYLQRSGLKNWPLAQKYFVFRPFAWLYQLFRYTGKGIDGLYTGKKVFVKGKNNMGIEDLLERLE